MSGDRLALGAASLLALAGFARSRLNKEQPMFNRVRDFLYPDAGRGAQPEVREAIKRFRQLPISERKKYPSLWGWLLGKAGTPPYKIERDWIEWKTSPVRGQKCANCQRWYVHKATGTGICDSVSGEWRAESWCSLWTVPMNKQTYRKYQR